jgi:hypothetical protein
MIMNVSLMTILRYLFWDLCNISIFEFEPVSVVIQDVIKTSDILSNKF